MVTLAVISSTVSVGVGSYTRVAASTVPSAPVIGGSIRIVADNDFALLAGDANNATRMILQNDVVWMQQAANAATYQINLNSGESFIYLLALHGNGCEETTEGPKEVSRCEVSQTREQDEHFVCRTERT